ncbi:hypothetical protein CHS0354_023106 [Potamilus streckersoni]|uniref:Ig-like domain-containing protein n=1 Tax=Potamilus streckersoni TaxID=2493646 RepID=A0AAE0TFW2_9BIVA|nr:hypothetical protein CHS0354_023106 [Potamilus streckersoni]
MSTYDKTWNIMAKHKTEILRVWLYLTLFVTFVNLAAVITLSIIYMTLSQDIEQNTVIASQNTVKEFVNRIINNPETQERSSGSSQGFDTYALQPVIDNFHNAQNDLLQIWKTKLKNDIKNDLKEMLISMWPLGPEHSRQLRQSNGNELTEIFNQIAKSEVKKENQVYQANKDPPEYRVCQGLLVLQELKVGISVHMGYKRLHVSACMIEKDKARVEGETGNIGAQGPPGSPGLQGVAGPKGDRGLNGPKGESGLKGDTGVAGNHGLPGQKGAVGAPGQPGSLGPKGVEGPRGDTGPTGPKGETGNIGAQGPPGSPGLQGIAGPKGDRGLNGPKGESGLKGDTGVAGNQGLPGEKGNVGAPGQPGSLGPKGVEGLRGDTGLTGPKGEAGLKGDPGMVGPQGTRGLTGAKGDIGIIGPRGFQGEPGSIGPQGPPGLIGPMGEKGAKGDIYRAVSLEVASGDCCANLAKPNFTKDSEQLKITEGSSVVMVCDATGSPKPSIKWDPNPAGFDMTRYHVGSDFIAINGTKLTDSGLYTCVANSALGTDKKTFTLQVIKHITLLNQPQNHTVLLGNPVSLECNVEGPLNPQIAWYHVLAGGLKFQVTTGVTQIDHGSRLTITSFSPVDDGEYICEASNGVETVDFSAYLHFYGPPHIISPTSLMAMKGDKVVVVCRADAHPPATTSWTYRPGITNAYKDADGNLVILNVQNSDAGEYYCTATNQFGSDKATITLSVKC